MRHLTLTMLAILGCSAAESDVHLLIAGDGAAIRAAALAAPPTSVIADPDAAETVAHVVSQWALLRRGEPEVPPLPQLIAGVEGMRFAMHIPSGDLTARPPRMMDMLWLCQTGSGHGAVADWLAGPLANMDAADYHGIAGGTESEMFLGLADDGLMVAGLPSMIPAQRAALDTPPAQPIVLEADYGPLASLLAVMAEDEAEIGQILDPLLPGWRDSSPTASVRIAVEDGAWTGHTEWRGLALRGLRPVAATTLARARAGADISLAVGLEPRTLLDQAVSFIAAAEFRGDTDRLRAQVDAMAAEFTGRNGAEVADLLTGDLLLQAGWAGAFGPLPNGVAVLPFTDRAAVQPLVQQLMVMAGAEAVAVEGAADAWQIPHPMGVVVVAVGADALVVATDVEWAGRALAGQNDEAAVFAGEGALHLAIAGQGLANRWLPQAWMLLQDTRIPMGDTVTDRIGGLVWPLRQAMGQPDAQATTLSAALLGSDNEWAVERLRPLFADADDFAAAIDASMSVYGSTEAGASDEAMPVIRTSEGWYTSRGWGEGAGPFASVDELLVAMPQGYGPLLGKPAEQLVAVAEPEIPIFDVRWLPTLDVMLGHVPEHWTVRLAAGDDGFTIAEHGLPVVTVLVGMGAGAMQGGAPALVYELRQQQLADRLAAVEAEQPELVAAMRAIATAIQAADRSDEGLPDTAAGLVTAGHLALADVAALFGGEAPSEAAALDALGVWNPDANGWPRRLYHIPLEGEWRLWAGSWDEVGVAADLSAPESPDAAVPGTR